MVCDYIKRVLAPKPRTMLVPSIQAAPGRWAVSMLFVYPGHGGYTMRAVDIQQEIADYIYGHVR